MRLRLAEAEMPTTVGADVGDVDRLSTSESLAWDVDCST